MAAIMKGHVNIMKLLLEAGAAVNHKQEDGLTPLHCVFSGSNPEESLDAAELLLDHGADLNARDNNGATPLDFARIAAVKKNGCAITVP
jgi:ankyrin repeat protein